MHGEASWELATYCGRVSWVASPLAADPCQVPGKIRHVPREVSLCSFLASMSSFLSNLLVRVIHWRITKQRVKRKHKSKEWSWKTKQDKTSSRVSGHTLSRPSILKMTGGLCLNPRSRQAYDSRMINCVPFLPSSSREEWVGLEPSNHSTGSLSWAL